MLVALLFWVLLVATTCSENEYKGAPASNSGELLARTHCASCHQYPEPDLLDRKSWEQHILPRMGYMLGVLPEDSIGPGFIEPLARDLAFANASLFRQETTLTANEWKAIRDFYLQAAPAQPILPEPSEITDSLPHFKVRFATSRLSPPSTTMVKFLNQQLWIGDAHTRRMYQFDQNMQLLNAANVGECLVDLIELPNTYLLTVMGSFSPTDAATGKVISLSKRPEEGVQVLLDSLRRPVHTALADLNGDGKMDLITCEFAKWTGRLAWWQNEGNGTFTPHILRNMPGAIRTYVHDFDGNGRPDIIALFGQGDEGIFIYYNNGSGGFREEQVLRFPPAYGSSYFDLVDLNNDDHPDIIYTAGDNADFPPVTKAYHGIYCFINDGNNHFQQQQFLPMPGAYAAKAQDFDQDGDLDMAAISFFPDYEAQPKSGFVYFQNLGDFQYKAHTFPEVDSGRWIVLDSGDIDGDSDLDLVLGSLAFEVIPPNGLVVQWTESGIPFVILENTLH